FCHQRRGGKGGVIIVGKPKTGEILALVSSPGFDPNVLADGISQEAWNRLLNDPQRPLNQRFLQSLYPPGSIFKLIVGLAAVEQGLEDTKRTIFCPGYFDYNGWRCPCWRKSGHGRLNFEEAIAQSCNVTFYTLGLELTERRIDEMAERFQFGEKRDIDLPGEGHGFLPTSRWKRQKTGEPWYPGDTINLSIGQGYLLVTPFEIYSMVTTIANRGKIYKPHLVKKILDEKGEVVTKVVPTIENTVKIKEQAWDQIIRGMGKVVSTGTGKACQDLPIKMAGKTGTAQNPQGADHSWFAGFFPLNDPEVSFVVLVEHGGDGSGEAAHRGRDLVQWYLENRGISQDETR
ncbi:MAG: penicillin-binding transpeptidase domain-containing protein, partial [Candidatus Atribacteria bacterium]|nr:penicillin-binding transpeptidase domain-containing protein [Candidatus Atribacteria bacterium]